MDGRRRRRLVLLASAAGAAGAAAYLLYRFLALDEETDEDRERRAERARQAANASSAAARAHVGVGVGAAGGGRASAGADAPLDATALGVGKKGTRWWYQAKQGVDKRASIAALQRAELAAREETETAMAAAQEGNLEKLTHLLEQGWSVDSRDKYGGTALHWAAGKGRVRIVEVLLQNKADPLARLSKGGGRGRTPLHYAARNGHLSVPRSRSSALSCPMFALHVAVQPCAVHDVPSWKWTLTQVCKLLVSEAKVPADAMTHDSTPPLHLAVWKGRLATAEWLLSVVDNLHYINDYGCDTSHWVAMSGDVETAKVAFVCTLKLCWSREWM